MKKLRIVVLTLALCFSFTLSSFGVTTLELSEKLEPVEAEVTQNIEQSKESLLDKAYPVGSVYTTTEDITAADMHRQFGGTWVQMKNTFLWAQDAKGSEAPTNTGVLGATGGMRNYNLSAVIGPDEDDELSFVPYNLSQYMINPHNYAFKGSGFPFVPDPEEEDPIVDPTDPGDDTGDDSGDSGSDPTEDPSGDPEEEPITPDINYVTEGSFSGSIPVTEVNSNSRSTEIMPPYIAVKMFKRTN